MEASQPAPVIEDPVRDREVDDRHPQHDEDAPCHELRAIGDGTADERRCDDREHQLEGSKGQQRDSVNTAVVGQLANS